MSESPFLAYRNSRSHHEVGKRMAINKQEFYEGAALHLVARAGRIGGLRYEAPFFVFNDRLSVLLKYCAKNRSPWGFTFTPSEQTLLRERATKCETAIGFICGADGVAAVSYEAYVDVAQLRKAAVHIACYRRFGQHYEVRGPDGTLHRKVAPSTWQKILEQSVLL
jgi:hypothetical protein